MCDDDDLPDLEPLSRREYVITEVEHLAGYMWPDDLANALDYSNAESLNTALLRWGRRDLAEKFERWRYDGNVPASIVSQVKARKKKHQEAA